MHFIDAACKVPGIECCKLTNHPLRAIVGLEVSEPHAERYHRSDCVLEGRGSLLNETDD